MRNRGLFVVALLIGLTACYFAEALFCNGFLAFRDLSRYFYPVRLFTVEAMKSGTIPLWNPYIFCGIPNLAFQQAAVFYPLSIVYYLLPFCLAFNVFLLIHIPLAGVFVYYLARRWGMGSSGSLVSAITFIFSGYVISLLNLPTTLSCVIWLPAVLLFFDKGLTDDKMKYILISSLFLGTMFLGGEPSIFYSTLWVLLFYALFFRLNNRQSCPLMRVGSYYSATVIFGSLLSMVHLAPFIELMRFSDRAMLLGAYSGATTWSMPVRDTFNFFIPFISRTDFSKESYWIEQSWAALVYLGVFSALLLAMTIFFKKGWRVWFLWFIGILFLFISFGGNTPFYYLIYKFVPGFKMIRYPVRFLYVTIFAAAMLCGAGFDAYIRARASQDPRLKAFSMILLPILLLSALYLLLMHTCANKLIERAFSFCVGSRLTENSSILFSIIAAIKNSARFAGFFTFGGLILFLGASRIRMRQGVVSFCFISLIVADLFTATIGDQPIVNPKIYDVPTPNVEHLKKDTGLFRFYLSPKTEEESAYIEGRTFEEAILNSKDMLTANTPMLYRFFDVGGYDSIQLMDYRKITNLLETSPSPAATRILDMLNMKYLVSKKKVEDRGYRPVEGASGYLYENTNVLPRAFLVDSFKVLKNEKDFVARFMSKEFDPAREVLLDEEPDLREKVLFMRPSRNWVIKGESPEKAEITKYSINEVVIRSTLNSPKFLVLADTWYPGWKVYVDNKRAKLYKADYILRAVYLEPGAHVVKFVFDPFSFKLGLVLSAITLIFILSYIAFARK